MSDVYRKMAGNNEETRVFCDDCRFIRKVKHAGKKANFKDDQKTWAWACDHEKSRFGALGDFRKKIEERNQNNDCRDFEQRPKIVPVPPRPSWCARLWRWLTKPRGIKNEK